jgi:spermidine synthase
LPADAEGADVQTLERAAGVSGELVLRRHGRHLEIVSNGVFLISTENEASSRALVKAARPLLPPRPLDVLIGGLGFGHALDEALGLPGLRSLTVAELEPTVLEWYRRYGGAVAARAVGDPRVRLLVADVGVVLAAASAAYDLVALDTDNGPDWLVREANAGLYDEAGLLRTRAALRAGGVAAFWLTGHNLAFRAALEKNLAEVTAAEAVDVVGGRHHTYVMYTGRVHQVAPSSQEMASPAPS